MPSERIPLVGGPLDGHSIPKQRSRIVWVSGRLVRSRLTGAEGFCAPTVLAFDGGGASPKPTTGRALYAREDGCFLYAGHRMTYCNACGCYHGRAEGGREKRPCALGGEDAER